MKKLLIGLFALGSISGFAQEYPERLFKKLSEERFEQCHLKKDAGYLQFFYNGKFSGNYKEANIKTTLYPRLVHLVDQGKCKEISHADEELFNDVLNYRYDNCNVYRRSGYWQLYYNSSFKGNFSFKSLTFSKLKKLVDNKTCTRNTPEVTQIPAAIDQIIDDLSNYNYKNCVLVADENSYSLFVSGKKVMRVKSTQNLDLRLKITSLLNENVCLKR